MESALNMEPLLLVTIVAGFLLLVAGIVALFMNRRRRKDRGADPADRLRTLVNGFEGVSPAFFHIMQPFCSDPDKAALLLDQSDIRTAVDLLVNQRQAKSKSGPKRRASLLDLAQAPPSTDKQSNAAMLTILRTIYLDPQLKSLLPSRAEREVDRLLDSLTESALIR